MSMPPIFMGKPCWVRPPEYTAGELPGILVEWRRTDQGFQGRVVWATAGYGAATVHQGWLPSDRIRPADKLK